MNTRVLGINEKGNMCIVNKQDCFSSKLKPVKVNGDRVKGKGLKEDKIKRKLITKLSNNMITTHHSGPKLKHTDISRFFNATGTRPLQTSSEKK